MTLETTSSGPAVDFAALVGAQHVLTAGDERAYYSTDLSFLPTEIADYVVQPGSVDELRGVVREAHAHGLATVARGGGMSYTRGYTPARQGTVLIDMRRLNRIEEVNVQDGYVTVEAGVTWEQLFQALRPHGVRTPYYGPLSGRYATVGGALSQNSVFWGAARHGMVVDSVLSLEVVIAGGELVRTGSAGRPGSTPNFRYFGPDLTGLFLADTNALGIKAKATLRLVPLPAATLHYSIAVPDFETAIECIEATGRLNLATEIYNLDPFYADVMAKAGLTFMANHPWTVHFTVDGLTQAIAEAQMAHLVEVAARYGTPIDPSTPAVFRNDPFGAVQAVLLGPEGQIWLPIHAVLPYSRAKAAAQAVRDFATAHGELLDRYGIRISYLTLASQNDFVFEPAFYWFDELGPFRLERISPEAAANWGTITANPEARAVVLDLRERLARVFDDLGGVHLQIGKFYSYGPRLDPATWSLLRALKQLVDPRGLMNPGSLGL